MAHLRLLCCICSINAMLLLAPYIITPTSGNPDAKRLYDDLLSSYNRLIRPVVNNTDKITVWLRLRLSQLMELNLKEQILTTNVWVDHEWRDHKFKWVPEEYGGVTELYVPSEIIWLPDIVLYNNADGEYIITTMTKAILNHDGRVVWSPPAIFKSSCSIDIKYFPFDQQECFMKFGSWTYDGYMIDLKHLDMEAGHQQVQVGMDLKEYYPSVEWDIMQVPAQRNEKFYPCCVEPYPDIYFNISLRRKTLFYTVNLIIPCVGLEYLSILVFYLPVYSGEKVALCICIFLSQTMYFLLISEIIPSTSIAMPLLGKFLLFSMFLVGFSVLVTIIVLNIHYRKPSTHRMAGWVRKVFIELMPGLLLMRVPKKYDETGSSSFRSNDLSSPTVDIPVPHENGNGMQGGMESGLRDRWSPYANSPYNGMRNNAAGMRLASGSLTNIRAATRRVDPYGDLPDCFHISHESHTVYPTEIRRSIQNVQFIHHHMVQQDKFDEEDDDWAFVAMVLDRLLLWVFGFISIVGTIVILCESPFLYDYTQPIDMQMSTVLLNRHKAEKEILESI